MLDVVTIALYKTGSSAHRHNDGFIQTALETGTKAVGHKLVDFLGGNAIQILVDIACANTRQHDLLHVFQCNLVVV